MSFLAKISPFFACILLLFSCEGKQNIPGDILPMDKMGQILVDMHLASALGSQNLSTQINTSDTLVWRSKSYRDWLTQKYKVDTATINRSFNFYVAHTDLMSEIYQQMILDANERLMLLDEQVGPKTRISQDSYLGRTDGSGYPVFFPPYESHSSGSPIWPLPGELSERKIHTQPAPINHGPAKSWNERRTKQGNRAFMNQRH